MLYFGIGIGIGIRELTIILVAVAIPCMAIALVVSIVVIVLIVLRARTPPQAMRPPNEGPMDAAAGASDPVQIEATPRDSSAD